MRRCITMMKLPITSCHSCSPLNHLNSFHRGMFKLNAKSDTDSLLYLLSHCECDGHTVHSCTLNGIYYSQWLVQWSYHCSFMPIPVHSPWLPGYINVMQTFLVTCTMAELFPDTPCKFKPNSSSLLHNTIPLHS